MSSGVISKHLQELMKVQIPSSKLVKIPAQETIKKPPKPISPPKAFFNNDSEDTSEKPEKKPEKSILDLGFKLENPETIQNNIQKFYSGGNRTLWIQMIGCAARQQSIPLIKEILYTKDKYIQSKSNYKALIKEYIIERNHEKIGSPSKPPFLATSKTPLSGSKHKACMLKKQKNQFGSKLEEMRCNVITEINKANTELLRTVFLVFSLIGSLAGCKKELIVNGNQQRNQNLEALTLARWKEKTSKNVEKKEFLRVLQESMNLWRANRVFLAFVDFKSRKHRGKIRVKHLQAVLGFRKAKKILVFWKNLKIQKRAKTLGIKIGAFYYENRVKLHFLYCLKVPKDLKNMEKCKDNITASINKPLSEWYQLDRVLNKNLRDYSMFFADPSTVNSYYFALTKSLGSYKGLLESTKKPLYVTSELPTRPFTDQSQKLNTFLNSKKVIQPTNMFTLSFANFKVNETTPNLVPDGFMLGFNSPCNKTGLFDAIKNVISYWRTLKTLSLSNHLHKSVESTKDTKGTPEKIAHVQYQFKLVSLFYQNWKRKYCKKWLSRLLANIRSLNILKNYFAASRAWKKYFSSQDDPKVLKLKMLRSENFYKNQQKIRSFFSWAENTGKIRAVKKLEGFIRKFLIMNFFFNWKHLSMCFEVVEDFQVDWKKFEEFSQERKGNTMKGKTVRFLEDAEEGIDKKKFEVEIKGPRMREKKVAKEKEVLKKVRKTEKKAPEKLEKKGNIEDIHKVNNKKITENEGTLKRTQQNTNNLSNELEEHIKEKMNFAETYHSILLKKKTMCGFIVIPIQHSLKLFYKNLKSKKFLQIKSKKYLKKNFDSLVSYYLLKKR